MLRFAGRRAWAWMLLLAAELASAGINGAAWAASSPPAVDKFYQPFRVERASLSPDGQHVVFAVRTTRSLEAHIWQTGTLNKTAAVPLDRSGNAELHVLGWISPEQLLAVAGSFTVKVIDPAGREARTVDTSNVFRRVQGADNNLRRPRARVAQAPDDPAALVFESTFRFPDSEVGIPNRTNILEVHRLNVLSGEVKRLIEYDVETDAVGVTMLDRQGKPRLVRRVGAQPPHFVYRTSEEAPTGLASIATLVSADIGWRTLDGLFPDRSTFSFGLGSDDMLGRRTVPLGFDTDPDLLYFASNLQRDTFGIYAADVRTGKRTEFAVEAADFDLVDPDSPGETPPLIFDRQRRTLAGVREQGHEPKTRWLDPEIAAVQAEIEKKFPGRRAQVPEWDETRERFLVAVSAPGDPGRYFVFHRGDGRCVEFLRAAPALPARDTNPAESFAFTTPAGVRLTGYLTLPRKAGKIPPPLVVALHGGPAQRASPDFDRDAQALAAMGFAVVRINYRGSAGFGFAHREALREHLDTAPLDDVLAALDWLRRERRRVDLRRVGVLGEGYGGYLALRALQLHPETFQCAVAVNGLVTPLDWWAGLDARITFPPIVPGATGAGGAPPPKMPKTDPRRAHALRFVSRQSGLRSISVAAHPELLTKPVLFLHNERSLEMPFEPVERLRNTLRRAGRSPEWQAIPPQASQAASPERARMVRRIGEFLNLTLHDFAVKIGEAKETTD